ncbi:MAG: Mbeg1-like protein, partial [Synechococcaceae cyanobacterium ELA182]
MATDPRVLLDAAFAAYGDTSPPGYNNTGQTIINEAGLYVAVYRKIGADEYIVAFRGTEQTMADLNTDVHKGWPQYKDSTEDIQKLIKDLLAKSNHVAVTGHSLGGALAQFAIYDLVAKNQDNPIDTSKFSLTTWNALGGKWALKQEIDYKPELLEGISATHYYRNDDLVSRLGRGHVGGDCIELRDPQGQIEGVLPAHMYDALLKGLEAGTGKIKNPDYLPIADSSQMIAAALIGYLETKPKSEDPINDFLDSFIGTLLLQIPIFENRLIVDIGILTGTIAIQQNLSRYDWSLPTLQMILDRAIKDYRISPAGCFSLLNGVLTSIELLTKDSSPLKAMMLEARPILSRIMDNLNASLAAIDMDRAMLLYWILMRGELMGLAGPEDIALLPGESSLMPFKDLMINGLTQAASYSCPLVLDLDGDGIETLSVEALNLHFDHDGNRYAERSGWVGPDDALLIYDRDGNQEIDKGAELFGSQTRLANGSLAANGFEALKEFDRNADGRVDAVDADWARLQLWRDRNSNGELDAGELQTLAAAGVASLELAYDNANVVDEQGNQHRQLGRYRTSQGELRSLV